jgi:sulfate adenylyltransferase subunit 2
MLLDPLCSVLHIPVMDDTQKLIARIDALATKTGASQSTLSRKLFGNGKRLDEIKAGGSLTLATYQRALATLSELERAPQSDRAA